MSRTAFTADYLFTLILVISIEVVSSIFSFHMTDFCVIFSTDSVAIFIEMHISLRRKSRVRPNCEEHYFTPGLCYFTPGLYFLNLNIFSYNTLITFKMHSHESD